MRIWASACLLLCLPASASAAGLFGATHPTLACGDDAILRSLSDHAITAQQSTTWRKTLFRQGDCHQVTPDIRWEKIANRNGLPLMRRVPPVPGLPPLYFMTGDIAPLAPAGPISPLAERRAAPVPAATIDHPPAPDTPTPEPRKIHMPAPVIVQHAETPLPTDLFFMTRGFQKLGSLILTLMLAGGAGWVMLRIMRTCWIMARRRTASRLCLALAEQHRPMLARWYQQAQAAGGAASTAAWEMHVERFAHSTLIPALARRGRSALWPGIQKSVQAHITTLAAGTVRKPPVDPITPGFYHQDMNQEEYAAFCSQWIEKAGWEIRPPVATGLGSVIQGQRNSLRMLVHCWIDRRPVHDDVILQGIKEKTDSKAHIGAIVSNAPYTQEALLLGKKHRIFLLHHEDIFKFVSGIEVPDVA
ncbi:restriction endonuclease [Komagataeibacter sp. FNDCF1]|uniref:restriction endonuclease n=1 Tax=Komagataeibacter sp. FNDCF1 TaxID=2878681 RepID=UPI001E28CFBE|nr:restriction endonuclease [Komagataeibacter sp. FNDCF1]MCE2564482.1 restriction endonuclease [Komagataeibacter sp. FNDCF1]